jgi:4-hydroxyphenylpyruvate dioxygenase
VQYAKELGCHGDHVKDVAFAVDDARAVWQMAVDRGATSVRDPEVLKDDDGEVTISAVATYGNVVHSFVDRSKYKGLFLPGFKKTDENDPLSAITPAVGLNVIDHVVGNQPDQKMLTAVEWYEKMLGFHRFWSVDDKTLHTEYSSLRSTVMASKSETVKMPLNEPAESKRKSQIQEYVDYYGDAGVQHVALKTDDILQSIKHLRTRGVKFLRVRDTYYELLRERLAAQTAITVKEDLDVIQELGILVDFDEEGYLLQLFTKPLQDRPTLFFEIIQRHNHTGFGVGNFKSLFESIERDQELRGNL